MRRDAGADSGEGALDPDHLHVMEFVGALGVVMTTTVTGLWHWRAVGVHEHRAIEKGEA